MIIRRYGVLTFRYWTNFLGLFLAGSLDRTSQLQSNCSHSHKIFLTVYDEIARSLHFLRILGMKGIAFIKIKDS
jgi:hypothetical protein